MRYLLTLSALMGFAAFPMLSGCGGDADANPTWGAMCQAVCELGEDCFQVPVGECVSLCLSELGNEPCKGDQEALDACVADIADLSCLVLDRGYLPESCENVCLCQSPDDCYDGNECTAGMCDVESGACAFSQVPDGVACAGEAGTCRKASCEVECTEAGIRTAVVTGGGPYVFACDGPTTVTTQGEIAISKDLILNGGDNLTVDAGGRHRVFSVSLELAPIVELHNLTISGGGETDFGGGIYNFGKLTLNNCNVSGNSARNEGGGIDNNALLTMLDSTVSGNTAGGGGGGIVNTQIITIVNSTIAENTAPLGGGLVNGALATVIDSTIEKNAATEAGRVEAGSGVLNGSYLTIVGSTISENVGDEFGSAGISNYLGELTMTNSTVSGNLGAGIWNSGQTKIFSCTIASDLQEATAIRNDERLTLKNSVILGHCDGVPSSEWESEGGNLESAYDACGLNHPTDQTGLTPGQLGLGPLQDNGGPTLTHSLGSRSVAIDAVPEGECLDAEGMTLTTDQRGVDRPTGPRCDAGAVESANVSNPNFPCTEEGIRAAIEVGGGPYGFACDGPTTVKTTSEIFIEQRVILDGGGLLTVDGDDSHRVFSVRVREGGVELRRMTVTGGRAAGGGRDSDGGAIYQDASRLTLVDMRVTGNYAERYGGGIFGTYAGELILVDSTVSNNTAGSGGGGVFTDIELNLTRSTVSGNHADGHGGGILIRDRTTTLTNSTLSGNTAVQGGGGVQNAAALVLDHSTVSNNDAPIGPAITNHQQFTVKNSILQGGCLLEGGTISSQGYNIESLGDTCDFDQLTDQVNVSPDDLKLGELADNGGPTETHALGAGSVAIDQIPAVDCVDAEGAPLTTDQRGLPRPAGTTDPKRCDVGAVEVQASD